MVRLLRLLFVVLVGLPVALGEAAPVLVAQLLRAQSELGEDGWSAIVAPGAASSPDAALVFEFANALWMYRPAEGTQSLSRHWNNVAADRRALAPLMQRIDARYGTVRELSAAEFTRLPRVRGPLPNGCFVQSVGEARRLARSNELQQACLLSYYAGSGRGHTVLCYEDADGAHIFDPADGRTSAVEQLSFFDEALALARRITPFDLAHRLTRAAKIVLAGGDRTNGDSGKHSARAPARGPVVR